MVKIVGISLLVIAGITAVIWIISYFIQPILPEDINNAGVLLFITLAAVLGALAAFKDTIELVQIFSGPRSNSPRPTSETDRIESIVGRMQSNLYGDDDQLMYVLTLATDLCELIHAPQYKLWSEKELHGYDNYQDFPKLFGSNEEFEHWMEQWAHYRFVTSYVEVQAYITDRGRYER